MTPSGCRGDCIRCAHLRLYSLVCALFLWSCIGHEMVQSVQGTNALFLGNRGVYWGYGSWRVLVLFPSGLPVELPLLAELIPHLLKHSHLVGGFPAPSRAQNSKVKSGDGEEEGL